jgi:hypothetical protein
VLWGPEDVAGSRIHSSDESVDPREIEGMVVAQALLLSDSPNTSCRRPTTDDAVTGGDAPVERRHLPWSTSASMR